jgi:outer membrane receptor for ferrienterochelin and colicins
MLSAACMGAANAQVAVEPPAAAPATAPVAEPAPEPATTPPADATQLQRVRITGNAGADGDEQRRQSTAARIIIGREEIDRFGDSDIGEVLKRLPGVTTGGAPGRRGGPRMRGLGGGYTQLLINGEPIPSGFSLESLPPDQVERIEILRAPTAEFGARAIAGTINIVLREALQRRLNDIKLTLTSEGGRASPNLAWTRSDKLGEQEGSSYSVSLTASQRSRVDPVDTAYALTDLETDRTVLRQVETGSDRDQRSAINLSSRLRWRLGAGDSLTVQPFVFASRSESEGSRRLQQTIGNIPSPYASAELDSDTRFAVARTNVQWQQRIGSASRLDLRIGGGGYHSLSRSHRSESDSSGAVSRVFEERGSIGERSITSLGKLSHELASEHSLVGGWDAEWIYRTDRRETLQNGVPLLPGSSDEVDARSRRIAFYLQDEWNPSPQWSAYAGLRWEQITTLASGAGTGARSSAVWTPLLQALWRPEPRSRDQVRIALTRSYKSPALRQLIARQSISSRLNGPSSPDTLGNPDLRPELATGLDLAFERHRTGGGLLSANLFYRRIEDLIRNVISEQPFPGSTTNRFVSQPRNIGSATTRGIELEAKGRLSEVFTDLPAIALRSNLSVFRSKVGGIPGPDNRLDEQPQATANLGADYRFRGMPLALGGNVNWTPAYDVQQTEVQRRSNGTRRSFEAFATWTFSPSVALRIAANDLLPLDYTTVYSVDSRGLRDATATRSDTRTQWTMRLELKL